MHNTMLTVLGTVMCLRVKEMDQLQICDVLWHFDAAFHIMYAQTLACRTYKRSSSTTPTAVQPRHWNERKSSAKGPPGHGPRPQRLGTRDRQPALKTRPARPPGLIFRAATAARPRLGGGKDLQPRKEFKFGETFHDTARQLRPSGHAISPAVPRGSPPCLSDDPAGRSVSRTDAQHHAHSPETVMCMRVNEMDQLQICDVLWHFDAAFHIMYAQTLAYRTCKGQVPRRRLQCSPVIGMTASQQPNSHRDTGPDPRGWAPVTGSRHSRPGPLGRPESSSGRRRRRGPALEAAKTCGQED